MNHLQSNLKKLLDAYEMSAISLARAVKLVYPSFHKIVSGETSDPRVSSLLPIAQYFNTSIEALVTQPIEVTAQKTVQPVPDIPLVKFSCIPKDSIENYKEELIAAATKSLGRDCHPHDVFCAIDLEGSNTFFPEPFSHATLLFLTWSEPMAAMRPTLFYSRSAQSLSIRKVILDAGQWILQSLASTAQSSIYHPEEWLYIGTISSYQSTC